MKAFTSDLISDLLTKGQAIHADLLVCDHIICAYSASTLSIGHLY